MRKKKLQYYIAKYFEFLDQELKEYFYPDRKQSFNVNFSDLIFRSTPTKDRKQKKYEVLYEPTVVGSGSSMLGLLSDIKETFEKYNFDSQNVSEDDNPLKGMKNTTYTNLRGGGTPSPAENWKDEYDAIGTNSIEMDEDEI